MKRKKLLFGIAAAALYIALLVLLTAIERADAGANITSLPLAAWYSLTTLTTVGYGDLYPVTALGRVIGAVFQLMSLGVLALIVGAFTALLRGKLAPAVKLRLTRKKEWFVFTSASPASLALAKALKSGDPERVVVFSGGAENAPADASGYVVSPLEPAALARLKKDGRISVFLMGGNSAENELLAREPEKENCTVYCMTEHEEDRTPERRRCFDPYDCCARLYWRSFPLLSPDETVVIVGGGKYAEAILARALELNVLDEHMHTVYRVFGDYADFRRDHYRLSDFLSADAPDPERDCLFFETEPWNARPELLAEASRLIFCSDREEETLERLTELRRWFPTAAAVHAKLSVPFDGAAVFGSTEELFTPELVMRSAIDGTAKRLNDIYRASAGGNAPDWNGLTSFARRSNIASAEHLRLKLRILLGNGIADEPLTPELFKRAYAAYSAADEAERERFRRIEHERWMRFHFMNNWRFADTRDNAARCHPLLLPYDRLTREEQLKDDFAWELLGALAKPAGE